MDTIFNHLSLYVPSQITYSVFIYLSLAQLQCIHSVARLGDLLNFLQVFKAFGNN